MSMGNPFEPMYGWRVDPDKRQERSNGPVIVRKMTPEEIKKYGIAKKVEDEIMSEIKGKRMTKETVKIMRACGKSIDEIVEEFKASYPNLKESLIRAKIAMLLSDKKPGGPKKSKAKENEEKLASALNSHEEHVEVVQLVQQETTTEVQDKVIEKTMVSAQQLAAEVDEMMEMVPAGDNINHPVHYTTGKIEVIDILQDKLTDDEFEGFCKGVILQYIIRSRIKGGLDDLKKARWYLDRLIKVKEAV